MDIKSELMNENEKRIKELTLRLSNKNTNYVVEAISGLRSQRFFEGVIRLIVEMYNNSDNTSIREAIKLFMNDLKETALKAEVVNELRKDYKSDTLEMVASSCWQSGLDYSEYAADFARLFARCEYMVALECFTVLEESANSIPETTRKSIIKIIKEGNYQNQEGKSALKTELFKILG